jgi:antitoxin (DNA-binding transcriptional repressor) of toxin-antitoxin stability system
VKIDKNRPAREQKKKPMSRVPVTRSGKSSRVISATRAARSFSELLDRVCYRGESFVIERGGELVCEMSRVKPPHFTGADFLSAVRSLPKPDAPFWKAVKETSRQKRIVPESPWES